MERDPVTLISEYLKAHPYLNLATVDPDGVPAAHTLGYASDGLTVYFMTDRNSRKAKNISTNPAVAYTVDEDYTQLEKIQGVQMQGSAEPVSDSSEIKKILEILSEKFPQIKELPESPDYVFFKVSPKEVYFIDNTVSFGYRDHVKI